MNVSLAEQARAFEEPGAQEHPPDFRRESRPASEQLPRQHEWRWIPDPAEVDLPTPSPNPDPGPDNALIRALAWANLHYWGWVAAPAPRPLTTTCAACFDENEGRTLPNQALKTRAEDGR